MSSSLPVACPVWAAATQAQESLNATGGGTVVAFEKSGTAGGAANMGMAFLAIESQLQKENMTNDFTLDDAFNFFMEYTHWRSDAKLVRRWFNMSASTVEWLQKMGVEFLGVYKVLQELPLHPAYSEGPRHHQAHRALRLHHDPEDP